ncbi:NADH:flavin oxidoreductase [Aurantiacibacter gangjinensis]|uniref:NADH:flavin oxidoreductase n=2 Tax=Aurantiacibacter gangjinensis TaxID=502682 RepID=A0A0G9MS88_9SPHN|nr:NADH:flavin oxidoreductase [Aurantiacibacter gangjinensis]
MPSDQSLSSLFKPLQMGEITLANRMLMAPLTRSRSDAGSNTQTGLHALYYAQRAGAGLIVSEATQISQQGQGYAWTPGIFTDEQVESWKPVTDAVHNEGGRIFCQLWHVGAISHPVFQPDGGQPVSASAWTPEGEAFVGDLHEDGPKVPFEEARALRTDEIPGLIDDYRHAARCAAEAGFEGVEVHAANNYLIDQFIRSETNNRDDEYGGSLENRLRLLDEVVSAVCEELTPARVGVRLSPMGGPGGTSDANPAETYPAAAKLLSGRGLAYLHVIRPNSHTGGDADKTDDIVPPMREAFDGPFIANGNFEPDEAAKWIADDKCDAVTFGRLWLANPDFAERVAKGGPYNDDNPDTYYGGGAEGYTDYPTLQKVEDTLPA